MRRTKTTTAWVAAAMILLLILDTKTATAGAAAGVSLCMNVLIPSLFPFFVVTTYLNASLMGIHVPGLRTIGKLLHIPPGSDSLLLLGLIGGYPVGAQLIADAYTDRKLSARNARIMLGYCSNAGPAFIFGVAGTLFSSVRIAFMIWGIHILSALITGCLLPRPDQSNTFSQTATEMSVVRALKKSISICASVCGWVVLFKIIMAYLELWIQNDAFMICLSGFMELSNGCLMLTNITGESARFILCSAFLSFGGICVFMQTASVTESLGLGLYLPGKICQTAISIALASTVSIFLFPDIRLSIPYVLLFSLICIALIILTKKYAEKSCGNEVKNHV